MVGSCLIIAIDIFIKQNICCIYCPCWHKQSLLMIVLIALFCCFVPVTLFLHCVYLYPSRAFIHFCDTFRDLLFARWKLLF